MLASEGFSKLFNPFEKLLISKPPKLSIENFVLNPTNILASHWPHAHSLHCREYLKQNFKLKSYQMKWTSDKHKYNLTRAKGEISYGFKNFLKKAAREKKKPFKKLTSYDERGLGRRRRRKREESTFLLFHNSFHSLPLTFLQPFFSSTNNFLQTFLGKIVSKLYSADDETEIKRWTINGRQNVWCSENVDLRVVVHKSHHECFNIAWSIAHMSCRHKSLILPFSGCDVIYGLFLTNSCRQQ